MGVLVNRRISRQRRTFTTADFVIGQIDDLQRASDEQRTASLGQNFFDRIKRWYNFDPAAGVRHVAYHPLVRVADLQMINLREAWELVAPHPKFFILNRNGRDQEREKVFNAQWKHLNYQMEMLYAQCFAGITGTGLFQVYFDPDHDKGLGAVRLLAREPGTYWPDPSARRDEDREYAITEDHLSLEEIANRYGRENAARLSLDRESAGNTGHIPKTFLDFPAGAAALPPGPLQTMGPFGGGAFSTQNSSDSHLGRIRVRSLYIRDSTMMPVTDALLAYMINDQRIIPTPEFVPKFPNGRVVVEAQRELMYDGPNPYPGIPVFREPALPALFSYWAPPPIRFTQDLQDLAEEMLSQVYENAYRTNNVMMFVQRISGLTSNDITGLPGTVYFTDAAAGQTPVQTVAPPQFPAHFLEYPKFLLQMQRELRGMTAGREGKGSAGNVGAGLFEAENYQAQALTRLRAALQGDVIQRVASFVWETMLELGPLYSRWFPVPTGSGLQSAVWNWEPLLAESDYQVILDMNSMRIDSATGLRNLAMALARFGLIDRESLVEALEWPDPERLIERMNKEQERAALLAMVSGQNQPKKGKR